MFEPNNTESKNSNQLFYPEWSIEPQPTTLEKFLNDQRKTPDNPNYVDYYDYYPENVTEIENITDNEKSDGFYCGEKDSDRLLDDWNYSDGLKFEIKFKRLVAVYIWQIYMPSLLLCIASTSSVFIPSQIVPGRMSLTVTSFLALVALFGNKR
jgi:hypothetical protein